MKILKTLAAFLILFFFDSNASLEDAKHAVNNFITEINAVDSPSNEQSISMLNYIINYHGTPLLIRRDREIAHHFWESIGKFIKRICESNDCTYSQALIIKGILDVITFQNTVYSASSNGTLDECYDYVEKVIKKR